MHRSLGPQFWPLLAMMVLSSAPGAARGATFHITGVVEDQSGAAIAGAKITFRAGASTVTTKSDAQGRFGLDETESATGTITVESPGFAALERPWSVRETVAPLTIVLAPAPISQRITVTATRTATRLSNTAADATVLSRQDLVNTAALTLDDKLRQLPGFSLFRRSGSRTANPTSQGVSLRGVGASGASRALVLEDGIPLNDPFGGWVYWDRVPREFVRDVEVVRGGTSDLYGTGALGGVINVLTRRVDESALSFETSYGNEATPDASLAASLRVNRWAAGIAAEAFHTDGYILVPQDVRGPVDSAAGLDYRTLDATLEREISDTARAFVRGSYFGEARENGKVEETNRTHLRQIAAGADWQRQSLGAFSVRAYGGPEIFDQRFFAVALSRSSENLTRLQRVPSQALGGSAQWSRPVGTRQTLVAGVDGSEVRGASNELIFGPCPAALAGCTGFTPPLQSAVGAGGRQNTVGVFGEDIVRLTPRWIVTAGGRIDHWSNNNALSVTRPLAKPGRPSVTDFLDRSENAFSPRLSTLYRIARNVSVHASTYRAFRAPTLNELYRSFRLGNVLTLANDGLRAERLTGAEAGAAMNVLHDRFNVRGTFFWSDITRPVANVTLSVTPALITRERENLGRTRARGVGLDFTGRLNSTIEVSGGYQFTDATVANFPANRSLVGLRIPEVPRHEATFQLRYANPSRITFALQGRAESAAFDDDQNLLRLGPYFTLDATVARRVARGFEVFAAAENLLDERYQVALTPVANLGPPILVRAGIRLDWGGR